jgi:hypothetical protein
LAVRISNSDAKREERRSLFSFSSSTINNFLAAMGVGLWGRGGGEKYSNSVGFVLGFLLLGKIGVPDDFGFLLF